MNFDDNVKIETELKNGIMKLNNKLIKMLIRVIFLITFISLTLYFIINTNILLIILFSIMFIITYLLTISSAYMQCSNKYYIEFPNKDSIQGFKITYKKKELDIKYIVDKKGRFAFLFGDNQYDSIGYKDNTKMNILEKKRVMEYICVWFKDNNLLSNKEDIEYENIFDGIDKKLKK